MTRKSRSGPTLPEERRRELGQLRVRLTAETAEIVAAHAEPGESPSATASRLLATSRKRLPK